MRYLDFIDEEYRPSKDDIICTFYIEPERGVNFRKVCGAIASESSVGTWTEVTTAPPYIRRYAARVFWLDRRRKLAKIAYPLDLFEPGNVPQLLSSVAGNVFGMKLVRNLRLLDIELPRKYVRSFRGPKFGIKGIRRVTKIKNRPLLGTIVKPKLGLSAEQHARVAYEAWVGGIDLVKDDENLTSLSFSKFERRVKLTLKLREKAERETGERKFYLPNITAETRTMLERIALVKELGGEYVMVDILTVGFGALESLREANEELKLIIHAHRAGHAAITKNPKHGITMRVIAKLARLIGVDQLHVGNVIGKMFEGREDVLANCRALRKEFFGLKPVIPVASGGLHPGHIPKLIKIFGNDVVLQFGGGCHGHPQGTRAGARAIKQALEATLSGLSLKRAARENKELRIALDVWSKA